MNELDEKTVAEQPATPARKTVTLAELTAEMAAQVAKDAGQPSELVPIKFRADVYLGVVEIAPTYVLGGIRTSASWTACIDREPVRRHRAPLTAATLVSLLTFAMVSCCDLLRAAVADLEHQARPVAG